MPVVGTHTKTIWSGDANCVIDMQVSPMGQVCDGHV